MKEQNNTIISNWWEKNEKIILIIIGILAFFSFINTFQNPFVWDDPGRIVENGYIKRLDNLSLLFSSKYLSYFRETTYRPLYTLTLFLNYHFFKLNVYGWRIFNIFVHILNTILIYFLIRYIFKNRTISSITALIFAIHPIHTEAVNVVVYRTELLACLFFLGSFFLYLKSIRNIKIKKGFYLLSIFMFILALCSKEMAASLPLIIVLYIYFFSQQKERKKLLVSVLPFFLIVLIWIVIARGFELPGKFVGKHELYYGSPFGSKLHLRVLSYMGPSILRYIWVSFLPLNLVLIYPHQIIGYIPAPMEFFSVLILVAILIFALKMKKFSKETSFSIFYFFISLLPVSQIIPLSVIYGERWLYIPSLGFCLLVAFLLKRLFFDKNLKKIGTLLLVSITCFYFFVTFARNRDWKDEVTLLEKNVNIYPQSMDARLQLAENYIRKKDYEKALYHIAAAYKMYPNLSKPYFSLAKYYAEKGPYNEAIKTFSNLLRDFPDECKNNADFYYYFGMAYAKGKLYDEAISHYKKVLALRPLRPYNRTIYNSLGNAYFHKNEFSKATESYKDSLNIDPDWIVPYHNLTIVYKRTGKLKEFARYFTKAVSLDSTYKGVLREPGTLQIKQK
ncbi:MAG TPA: DUF6056 family protein [bacterium]|nr:DUF6056 family protein [bacterium]